MTKYECVKYLSRSKDLQSLITNIKTLASSFYNYYDIDTANKHRVRIFINDNIVSFITPNDNGYTDEFEFMGMKCKFKCNGKQKVYHFNSAYMVLSYLWLNTKIDCKWYEAFKFMYDQIPNDMDILSK